MPHIMFSNFFLSRRKPCHAPLATVVRTNNDFRRVLHTGVNTQIVAMALPPGVDIGSETHRKVEQLLFVQSGHGVVTLNGETSPIGPGDAVAVPPGVAHNVKNTGKVALRLHTIYSPPNHIDGRVHATRAEADADVADEEFGKSVGG